MPLTKNEYAYLTYRRIDLPAFAIDMIVENLLDAGYIDNHGGTTQKGRDAIQRYEDEI